MIRRNTKHQAFSETCEAKAIIDDEGETHFADERYSIGEDGRTMVRDYPDIEYLDE